MEDPVDSTQGTACETVYPAVRGEYIHKVRCTNVSSRTGIPALPGVERSPLATLTRTPRDRVLVCEFLGLQRGLLYSISCGATTPTSLRIGRVASIQYRQ
jgi:hypothetical protein